MSREFGDEIHDKRYDLVVVRVDFRTHRPLVRV
jgi:hypothetical protein